MKLKYYLRGIATGILFTLCVLTLTGTSEKEKMSDSEIIHAAKALGMTETEGFVKISGLQPTAEVTKSPLATSSPEPTSALVINTVTPTATPTDSTTETVTPTVPPTGMPVMTETVTPTKTPTPNPVSSDTNHQKLISFQIVKGMYSNAVAQEAYRIGLVENADEFDRYLVDHGYASLIRIGTYQIKQGATYSEIAVMICGKTK